MSLLSLPSICRCFALPRDCHSVICERVTWIRTRSVLFVSRRFERLLRQELTPFAHFSVALIRTPQGVTSVNTHVVTFVDPRVYRCIGHGIALRCVLTYLRTYQRASLCDCVDHW